MASPRLKWLRIHRYRNVAPGTELVFGNHFNVLLGKNGTGKTTLLRLIAMIVSGKFGPLKDEPLDIAYDLHFAGLDVKVEMRNAPAWRRNEQVEMRNAPERRNEPDILRAPPELAWAYEISLVLDESQRWAVVATALGATLRGPTGAETPVPTLSPFVTDVVAQAVLTVLDSLLVKVAEPQKHVAVPASLWAAARARTAGVSHAGRFDEALAAFDAMTEGEHTQRAGDLRRAYLLMEADDATGVFVPDEIIRHTVDPKQRGAGGVPLPLRSEDVPLLQKFVAAAGVVGAEMTWKLSSRRTDEAGRLKLELAGFDIMVQVDESTTISHDHLSNGQKRLLSFLYYAAANPDIVIADELANGMHHDWVQTCVDEISDRQSFLASQDPLLFDFLTFDSQEVVKQSFILCGLERRDGRGTFTWKNLDDAAASSFYRAYEAGIQHVSEILRTKGLW